MWDLSTMTSIKVNLLLYSQCMVLDLQISDLDGIYLCYLLEYRISSIQSNPREFHTIRRYLAKLYAYKF